MLEHRASETPPDAFLVCGLGELGWYCLEGLLRFSTTEASIQLFGLDAGSDSQAFLTGREVSPEIKLFAGDCRLTDDLIAAGIRECRGVLFVTSSESTNIQGALVASRLNPSARVVVRCNKANLNRMLHAELPNFVALDPDELPASSFVTAALKSDTICQFEVEEHRFEVTEQHIDRQSSFRPGDSLVACDQADSRVISWISSRGDRESPPDVPSNSFFQWNESTRVGIGDRLVRVQPVSTSGNGISTQPRKKRSFLRPWRELKSLAQVAQSRWKKWFSEQTRRPVIFWGLIVGGLLLATTAVLLRWTNPETTWIRAIGASVVLLTGGYADVFGGLTSDENLPDWLQLYGLLVTGFSLVFLVGVLGIVTDTILNARLAFLRRRVPIPREGHVVLVGYGTLGKAISRLLRRLGQPMVVVSDSAEDRAEAEDADIPALPLEEGIDLDRDNLARARGAIILTPDELLNLEMALSLRQHLSTTGHPLSLVVRMFDDRFAQNLRQFLPEARVLTSHQLAGEAFAAAAFGEQVLALFRLNEQSIFVIDTQVRSGDHLTGLPIAEATYGYGIVPILLRRNDPVRGGVQHIEFPGDDLRLMDDDRLTLLASLNGLRRVERGQLVPPLRWRLTMQPPLSSEFLHGAGAEIARSTRCQLGQAMEFVNSLPGSLELEMYTHQANRLRRSLSRRFKMELVALENSPPSKSIMSGRYPLNNPSRTLDSGFE